MRFQNKGNIKKKKSSILLVTLSAVVLLLFFAMAIYNMYKNYHYAKIRDFRLTQIQWQARSFLAYISHQIVQSPDTFQILLDKKGMSISDILLDKKSMNNQEKRAISKWFHSWKGIDGSIVLEKTAKSNHYQVSVALNKGSTRAKSSLVLNKIGYSDYLFYFNKNIQLIAVEQPLRFYGPIFVAGNLELGAYGGHISFFKDKSVDRPLLYTEGKISEFRGINNPRGIVFGIGNINAHEGDPVRDLSRKTHWQNLRKNNEQSREWVLDSARGASRIAFLSYNDLVKQIQAKAKKIHYYSLGKRGPFSEKMIINPKLLQKQFLGAGTGSRSFFNHNLGYIPQRVYVTRIQSRKNAGQQKVHPIYALDNSKEPDQNVSYGSIQFKKEVIPLDLPDDAFSNFGTIKLGGRGWSRIAQSLPIRDLYLNGKIDANRLKGNQYFYDATKKELRFFNTIHSDLYRIIPDAKPDGKKRDFVMMDFFPAYGYVNGKKQKMTAIKGRMIFDSPPPAGSTIGVLTKKPDIYIRKEMPVAGTGVYVDKPVHALSVNLSQLSGPLQRLDTENSENIVVYFFYCPVFVYGQAKQKVIIVSVKDIYLGNINEVHDQHSVTLVSQGVIWALNEKNKPLVIKRAWLYSAGDQLFSVHPNILKENKKHVFLGSAIFSGQLTNAFVEKDLGSSYLYTIEYFENWNFIYDSRFLKAKGAPPGVPVTFTIEGIQW